MEEEKLILLVSGYKELYNLAEKNYSNQEIKNNCWKEIAKQMGQPMTDCKERWSRLRDNYRKALKFRKTKSGDAAIKVRPCKFEKEMSFLNKYLPDREQKTNIEHVCLVNSPAALEEETTDRVEGTSNTDDLESLGQASASTNTIFRTTPTSLPNKKKKRTPNTQPHSVASVLEKYLETTTATASTNNSLKQFFIAMYETAQAFPPGLQIQVKSKIFSIIQEAELSCLQANDYPQFPSAPSSGYQAFQRNPHLHPQYVQPLVTQEMTSLQLQNMQHSQDVQLSQSQHIRSSQQQRTFPQHMQPSLSQEMQSTSSTSTSLIGSPELSDISNF